MAQTWKSKYGTVIDISGLTPQQVKQVQQTAQGSGAYGSKATALANSLRKKNSATPKAAPGAVPAGPATPNLGINDKTGAINSNTATGTVLGAVNSDTAKTFGMQNPDQVDVAGNSRTVETDPVTGKTKIVDTAGSSYKGAMDAFTGALSTVGGNGRQSAQDASYNFITRNYARDQARELEDAKQELAQRGIPIDGGPNSLWSKTVGGINDKYRDMRDQASNQALLAGNEYYATNANAANVLGSTVAGQNPNFTQYQGGQSTVAPNMQQLLSTISSADAAKYNIDQNVMLNFKRMAADKEIANKRIAASRAGGGGGSDPGFVFGGEAI